MDLSRYRGTAVALVTPFDTDGSIDLDAFELHVEGQIAAGVDVLVPCGTTGESATTTASEQRELIAETVRIADGRVPVMGGAGSNSTEEAVKRARGAQNAGADAILSISPYYNKPTAAGLVAHYRAIADSVDLPVFVYNVPGRTGSNIDADTLLRLFEIDGIVGVKEASGDLEQVMEILERRPDGVLMLSGEDSLTLAILALGGDGVVSVVANEAPKRMSEMVHAALGGRLETARELHYRLLPLMRANFLETNPIPVKTALEMMGRMTARFREPLVPMSDSTRERLRDVLDELGLL